MDSGTLDIVCIETKYEKHNVLEKMSSSKNMQKTQLNY